MTMSEATAGTLAPGSLMKRSATSGIQESRSATIARPTYTRAASRTKRRSTAKDQPAGGVGRDRSLERFELRRHRERLPRDRFDREIQWDREDQRDRGREGDLHAAPISSRMASMIAACTSRVPPAIGTPNRMLTRFDRYAGSANWSSVAVR